MREIKILLTSDMHLGKEFCLPDESKTSKYDTLNKIANLAISHDILLIAGDFINVHDLDNESSEIISGIFSDISNSGTEIFYTPGPVELNDENNIHEKILNLDKNIVFFQDEIQDKCHKSKHGDIYIHGIQAKSNYEASDILKKKENAFNLGLFHINFRPKLSQKNIPECLSRDDLKKMNFDFYALGMNHTFKMFRSMNNIIGAYPGSPEPCCFDESGDKFVISMTLNENSLEKTKRIAVNSNRINNASLNCQDFKDSSELIKMIEDAIVDNFVNIITLTGSRSMTIKETLEDYISKTDKKIKIKDNSIPSLEFQIEHLENENSSFYNILLNKIEKEKLSSNLTEASYYLELTESLYHSFSGNQFPGEEYCTF